MTVTTFDPADDLILVHARLWGWPGTKVAARCRHGRRTDDHRTGAARRLRAETLPEPKWLAWASGYADELDPVRTL